MFEKTKINKKEAGNSHTFFKKISASFIIHTLAKLIIVGSLLGLKLSLWMDLSGGGGGQVVRVIAFYSDNSSSIPPKFYL